jgi:hypothetical protein
MKRNVLRRSLLVGMCLGLWVHYVILTSGHLRSSIVVGWKETMVDHPTCGGAPDGHGSRNLL